MIFIRDYEIDSIQSKTRFAFSKDNDFHFRNVNTQVPSIAINIVQRDGPEITRHGKVQCPVSNTDSCKFMTVYYKDNKNV